jgi:hypothetical protein
LRDARVVTLIDTRLRTGGQLAAFAKMPDLAYFARELAGIEYRSEPLLAPTAELLDAYRGKALSWEAYAAAYRALLADRAVEREIGADVLERACLLCSEASPARCHRRIAAEYLAAALPEAAIEIAHL